MLMRIVTTMGSVRVIGSFRLGRSRTLIRCLSHGEKRLLMEFEG